MNFLEGILLFIIVWLFASKPRPRGSVTSVFLISYAILRIFCELFRVPDNNILLFGYLTIGMILSLPMLVAGILLLILAYKLINFYFQTTLKFIALLQEMDDFQEVQCFFSFGGHYVESLFNR